MARYGPSGPCPAYIQDPADACTEGAGRLNFVLEMLAEHDWSEKDERGKDKASIDKCNGYDVVIIEEQLTAVRDLLYYAAHPRRRSDE